MLIPVQGRAVAAALARVAQEQHSIQIVLSTRLRRHRQEFRPPPHGIQVTACVAWSKRAWIAARVYLFSPLERVISAVAHQQSNTDQQMSLRNR